MTRSKELEWILIFQIKEFAELFLRKFTGWQRSHRCNSKYIQPLVQLLLTKVKMEIIA